MPFQRHRRSHVVRYHGFVSVRHYLDCLRTGISDSKRSDSYQSLVSSHNSWMRIFVCILIDESRAVASKSFVTEDKIYSFAIADIAYIDSVVYENWTDIALP